MKHFLIFILLLTSKVTFSFQSPPQETIKKIMLINTKNYSEIDSLFNKYKRDEKSIQILIEQAKKNNYPQAETYGYNMLGRHYRTTTKYDKSIENHLKAIQISRKNNEVETEVISLNMMGVVHRRADNIPKALDYHQQAYELASNTDPKTISILKSLSISDNSIGNIYLSIKQYELALEKFKSAYKIQKKLNDARGMAINHQNMGYAYEMTGNLEKALKNYKTSLLINEQRNSDFGRVICNNSIAGILMKQSKPQKALDIIEPNLAIALKNKDQYYIANTHTTLGWTQIGVGKLEDAENNLLTALSIAEKYHFNTNKAITYKYLSKLYSEKKQYKRAYESYKNFVDTEAETFNQNNLSYVNSLISSYEKEKTNNKIKDLVEANKRNKNLLIISLASLALLGILAFSLFRYRSIRNEKRILTLKQDALRSQMNPHFVFNVLNSIKLFIINNDQKNGIYYLNKFSKLIRKILEASTIKEVSLSEELDTMDVYMSIENIRFSNEINYVTEIDKNLSIDVIKVPPLVLQPFLENAIWHGLSSKKGEKEIVIRAFKLSDTYIQIEINDNGIGREASAKIKEGKSIKRKSIGVNLTKARLSNFSKYYDNYYEIDYLDLKNNGVASGTSVIIKIPLK